MCAHTGSLEDGAFMVETINCCADSFKSFFIDDRASDQVAKFQESTESVYHSWGHMTRYSWQVYLAIHEHIRRVFKYMTRV